MDISSSGRFSVKVCRTDGANISMTPFSSGYVPMKYSKEFTLYLPIYFGYFKDAAEIRIEWHAFGAVRGGYIDVKNIELHRCGPLNISNTQFDKLIRNKYTNPYKNNDAFVSYINGNKTIRSLEVPKTGTWNIGDIVYNTDFSTNNFIGWVCTESGTPGIWRKFGALT